MAADEIKARRVARSLLPISACAGRASGRPGPCPTGIVAEGSYNRSGWEAADQIAFEEESVPHQLSIQTAPAGATQPLLASFPFF